MQIVLERPGAGLPWPDLILARLALRAAHTVMSGSAARNLVISSTTQILDLASSVSSDAASHPVLIPPTFGLEDSSRYWSIFMTIEHLVIVNTGIIQIIDSLAAGRAFPRQVRTEDVKPSPGCGREILEKFQSTNEDYLSRLDQIPNLRTVNTHNHPWFGPFNAHRWNCLAGMHQMLHKRQINKILTLLR